MAPGTGILLNNEVDDFSANPGVPNAFGLLGGEANAIEPARPGNVGVLRGKELPLDIREGLEL